MRSVIFLPLLVLVVAMFAGQVNGQPNPDYQFILGSGSVAPGSTVEIAVVFDNNGGNVQGWSWGVCSDPSAVLVEAVAYGNTTATANNGAPPDFYELNLFPDGWTVGAVISFVGSAILPPGTGYELNVATYSPVGALGTIATIDFCGQLGNPPWLVVVVVGGMSFTPVQNGGTITVEQVDSFIRGHVNGDSGFNIADVVTLLGYLFNNFPTPGCLDASDGNDDGSVNLADAITLFNTLFVPGSPAIPPPSSTCGVDPTDDTLDCGSSTGCP